MIENLPDKLTFEDIIKMKVSIANNIENEIGRCEDILKWGKDGVIGNGKLTQDQQDAIEKLTEAWEGFEEFVLNRD